MSENDYSIQFELQKQPYNCILEVPLPLLQRLTPILKDSILAGLVGSDQFGRVILHLNLTAIIALEVEQIIQEYDGEEFSGRRRYRA